MNAPVIETHGCKTRKNGQGAGSAVPKNRHRQDNPKGTNAMKATQASAPAMPSRRLIRRGPLLQYFGVKETTLYEWAKNAGFPASFNLGGRTSYWDLDEIDAWIDSRRMGVTK